jgi:hypothetical protein
MIVLLVLIIAPFFRASSALFLDRLAAPAVASDSAQPNAHRASNSCLCAWPLSSVEQPLVYAPLPKDSWLSSRRRSSLARGVRIRIGVTASRPSNHKGVRPEVGACPPMKTGPAYRDTLRPLCDGRDRPLLDDQISVRSLTRPACHAEYVDTPPPKPLCALRGWPDQTAASPPRAARALPASVGSTANHRPVHRARRLALGTVNK